jgi:hypothetical protein
VRATFASSSASTLGKTSAAACCAVAGVAWRAHVLLRSSRAEAGLDESARALRALTGLIGG